MASRPHSISSLSKKRLLFILLTGFFFFFQLHLSFGNDSISSPAKWKEQLQKQQNVIKVYYFPINPFIYKGRDGHLLGIEHEIMIAFQSYVKRTYEIPLKIQWILVPEFGNVVDSVAHSKVTSFGASALSYTRERAYLVNYTAPYMPDINILISSHDLPTLSQKDSISAYFQGAKGISVRSTTYLTDLEKLRNQYLPNMKIELVGNDENMVEKVAHQKGYLAYCSLPYYIRALQQGYQVKRQGVLPISRDGHRLIYSKHSAMDDIIQEFFNSYEFKAKANNIIRNYLGDDNSELLWDLANLSTQRDMQEIKFLNKEKEIQFHQLVNAALDNQKQRYVVMSITVGLLLLFFIVLLLLQGNRRRAQDNRKLNEKRKELELTLQQLHETKDEIENQKQLLQDRNQELKDINDQKNDLIGIVAHDLKSPINQMHGLAELLRVRQEKLEREDQEILVKMVASAGRLRDMVDKILDIEAVDNRALQMKIERIDLAQLMRETIEAYQQRMEEKQLKVHHDALQAPMWAKVDEEYTHQVFENLISNAIKYSPIGKEIYVFSKESGRRWVIGVKDEGPGLSEEDQKKLFGKFQRLSSKPTANEKSTGLGLSIVKKIVETMNGKVWCESELGNGSTFFVSLVKIK